MTLYWIIIAVFALPVMFGSITLFEKLGINQDISAFSSIIVFMAFIIGGLSLTDKIKNKRLPPPTPPSPLKNLKLEKKKYSVYALILMTGFSTGIQFFGLGIFLYCICFGIGLGQQIYYVYAILVFAIILLINFFYVLYMKKRLAEGKLVTANVEIIRYGYVSRMWSRLTYQVDGEVYTKEMEICSGHINTENTLILSLNPKNYKKFIILPLD